MKVNWLVRLRNKSFWLCFVPAVLLLVKQILALFGVDIDIAGLSGQLEEVITTVFVILALLGIVNDPTTSGLNDSAQAMDYEKPKGDE